MVKTWPTKDPDERLDYVYDWAPDLGVDETLVSRVFTVTNAAGVVLETDQLLDTSFIAWLSGGIDGEEAAWTLRVTTSENRILEDTVVLPIVTKIVPMDYPGGYAAPTPGQLIALHPEFSGVPPMQLSYYLARAARAVDTSWSEGDFGHARMLLAAHYMTLAGLGTSAAAAAIRSGADQFRSMGIASLRLERFDKSKGSQWLSTPYGTEFAALLRQNRGGPRVTGMGALRSRGDGDNFGPWTQ